MRKAPVVLVVLAMFGLSSVAFGKRPPKEFQYSGWHPVAKRYGGKFCYADGPHAHPFRPSPRGKFKESAGRFVFLGEPSRYGFEGQQYSFDGPHPVPDAPEPLVCKIRGLHRHFFEPPRTPEYRDQGGVAHYEGLDLRGRSAKRGTPVTVRGTTPSVIPAPPPVAKAPPVAMNKQVAQAPHKPARTNGKSKEFMPREDDD